MSDAWEAIRHETFDALVTQTKLAGTALVFNAATTPEGWPVTVVIAVGKPGSEIVPGLLAQAFRTAMKSAGAPETVTRNPNHK